MHKNCESEQSLLEQALLEQALLELEVMNSINQQLAGKVKLVDILEVVTQNTLHYLNIQRMSVTLVNGDRTKLIPHWVSDVPQEVLQKFAKPIDLTKGYDIGAECFREQKVILCLDPKNDPRVDQEIVKISKTEAFAILPLVVENQSMGFIGFEVKDSNHFITEADIKRYQRFTDSVALIIKNGTLYQEQAELLLQQQEKVTQLESLRLALHRQNDHLKQQLDTHSAFSYPANTGENSQYLIQSFLHEFNNRLQVLNMSQAYNFQENLEELKSLFPVFQDVTEQLTNLVVDFEKLVYDNKTEAETCNLNLLLHRAYSSVSGLAIKQGIIIKELLTDTHCTIQGHSGMLLNAFFNLLKNAVEAITNSTTGDDAREIQVQLSDFPEHYQVDVANSGKEISSEISQRIFEAHFTTKLTGKGIGLSLVKQVMDKHNATIDFFHRDDSFNCFQIKFPK